MATTAPIRNRPNARAAAASSTSAAAGPQARPIGKSSARAAAEPQRRTSNPRGGDELACADRVMAVVPSVMDALRGAMRQHVGEQLSVPQFRCLNFIAQTPGTSVGAVASFLGVTMPTASAMVDRLVRAGAMHHEADPADRRRSRLYATPEGLTQLNGIRREARQDLARALAGRPPEELHALMAGLDVLQSLFSPPTPSQTLQPHHTR